MRRFGQLMVLAGLVLGYPPGVGAQTVDKLKRMSLEELIELPITTVSRTPEPTVDVPAAVYVITRDDIERSGVTTLAEAMGLAPGVEVSRIDGNKWAIGVRGFADRLARAMLVMIDGRAVYSPLFAGTYWEVQDTWLPDVERIEVVRGPGGTLWGANAVTGIINIVTRPSRDTQGLAAEAGAGSFERAFGGLRYGGRLSHGGNYRIYAKGADVESGVHADGVDFDTSHRAQFGGRADWVVGAREITVQGDAYTARAGQRSFLTSYAAPVAQSVLDPAELSGGNILTRLSVPMGAHASSQLQVYYDRTNRTEPTFAERRDTVDVDLQTAMRPWRTHQFGWGGAYRYTAGDTTPTVRTTFFPADRADHLFSAFLQDEIGLVSNRLRLTLGSKVEHNGYSGVEVQPTARLLWSPSARDAAFVSITRAVRTPSRIETDLQLTSSLAGPTFLRVIPNPDFVSETLVAYEAGYRVKATERFFLTAATFLNRHDHVLSTEVGTLFPEFDPGPAHLILPLKFGNGLKGISYGTELTMDWRPLPRWRVASSYSFLRIEMSRRSGSGDVSQETRNERLSPHHQVQLQSSFELPHAVDIDGRVRHVSSLDVGPVPVYTTAALRVAKRFGETFTLSLVAKDFLTDHHLEFPGGAVGNVEVGRSAFVAIGVRLPSRR